MLFRPAFAEIDLSAIRHNAKQYLNCLPPNAQMMAVVKADGYGHGAAACLNAAITEGVQWAAVALVKEAIELRQAGVQIPILLLGGIFPGALEELIEWKITPTAYSLETLALLNDFSKKHQIRLGIHLKLDSGMGRLGLNENQLERFLSTLSDYPHLEVEGIMTHFASADEPDKAYSQQQLQRFHSMLTQCQGKLQPRWIHASNSAGTSELGEERGNLFRVGIGLYGQQPSQELVRPLDLKEALSLKSQIIQIQDFPDGARLSYGGTYICQGPTRIATLAIGYADGYPRLLSNQGRVLIRGQFAPIRGRVCMDMILVDVTQIEGVQLFDAVTLIGSDGPHHIPASEIATLAKTINYEVTCGISKRIPRIYKST